jgi:CheY-like chemotaxis protein
MKGSKGLIALVDDDPAILLTVGDQLESQGYAVVKAESAEQCLQVLRNTHPDLIILDIAMPGAGGLSFLSDILLPTGMLKYPVLVFTARAELDGFFDQTPVDGFLPKTCDPDRLLNEVERIIAKRRKAEADADADPGRSKVLVAEDDPVTSNSLRNFFKSAGCQVMCSFDGQEVIECAIAYQPDIILLKYFLANMNGPAVAKTLATMRMAKRPSIVLYDDTGLHPRGRTYPDVAAFVPGNDPSALLAAARSTGMLRTSSVGPPTSDSGPEQAKQDRTRRTG